MSKEKYAIFRDDERITEWFADGMSAVLAGIDRGYFELINGADWNSETKTLRFDNATFPRLQYSIPSAPICYEVRKRTEKVRG